MSATDIIKISVDEFLHCRVSCVPDPKITERINQIVSQYTCFSETIGCSKPSEKGQYHPYPRQFKSNAGVNRGGKPTMRAAKAPCFDRDALSLLNKLADRNKDVITQKVVRLCAQNDNCDKVVRHIIDRGYKFGQYKLLLVNILSEIKKRYNSDDVIDNYLDKYVDTFAQDLLSFCDEPPKVEHYDAYCAYIKKKDGFLARFEMFLYMAQSLQCEHHITSTQNDITAIVDQLTPMSFDVLGDVYRIGVKAHVPVPSTAHELYHVCMQRFANIGKKTIFKWQALLGL